MSSAAKTSSPGTIGECLRYFGPECWAKQDAPGWPPDAFALTAAVLRMSGAYRYVVRSWPPAEFKGTYQRKLRLLGREWSAAAGAKGHAAQAPQQVRAAWKIIIAAANRRLRELSSDDCAEPDKVCEALLLVCAASDEASAGAGISWQGKNKAHTTFLRMTYDKVQVREEPSTLCEQIDHSKLRVLPKQHTPQHGLTIRSLTHNLALVFMQEVAPYWRSSIGPQPVGDATSINLLIVPWPYETVPSQFKPAPDRSLRNLPSKFGFFSYEPREDPEGELPRTVAELLQRGEQRVGPIHGVVLPELALADREGGNYKRLEEIVISRGAFLVCGVARPGPDAHLVRNCLRFTLPTATGLPPLKIEQWKQHRWALDKSQILNYNLGSRLDPARRWWENSALERRKVNFVSVADWLTICPLICEDLARQEPVAEVVRAVGPNLVLALLMDGPQLDSRWPARYASVLADDPGSSVLTLTSLGMAELSRPPGKELNRTIAMWRDRSSGTVQIKLPDKSKGVVLSITREEGEEWTADGRSDSGVASSPILTGLHFVEWMNPAPDLTAAAPRT